MSLYCPKCKAHSQVIDSRYVKTKTPPYIRRTRSCPRCKRRWSTIEMLASAVMTASKRRSKKGRSKSVLLNVIRREEYALIADEMHKLADRIAIGDMT